MMFVIDASVALAWCFDDDASGSADDALGRLENDEAIAPADLAARGRQRSPHGRAPGTPGPRRSAAGPPPPAFVARAGRGRRSAAGVGGGVGDRPKPRTHCLRCRVPRPRRAPGTRSCHRRRPTDAGCGGIWRPARGLTPCRHEGDGAGDGTRTRDILLGKQTLYRLSYSRPGEPDCIAVPEATVAPGDRWPRCHRADEPLTRSPSPPTLKPMRPAPHSHRIHTFRHWAPMFEVFDHESGPTSVAVVAAGSTLLTGLALVEGHPLRDDVGGLTLVAFLALTALGAALVMAAGEAFAWLLARPVGRDLARAAASLERARVAVARIRPIVAADDVDLAPYAARIERSTGDLEEAARGCRCCHRHLRRAAGACPTRVAARPAACGGASDRSRGGGARRRVPSPPLDRGLSVESAPPRGTHPVIPGPGRRRAARSRPRLTTRGRATRRGLERPTEGTRPRGGWSRPGPEETLPVVRLHDELPGNGSRHGADLRFS